MGENTHQNCTRQNKNKEDPGRQQPCWGFLFCTNLTQPTGNLDSKSGKIVIDALTQINREFKKTIVMVTHDPQMASYCSRIILLKDGLILDTLKRGESQEAFYQEIIGRMAEL
jgi:ABC-type cobalamin/Fe3+-siderophores transport system ATPase subunit